MYIFIHTHLHQVDHAEGQADVAGHVTRPVPRGDPQLVVGAQHLCDAVNFSMVERLIDGLCIYIHKYCITYIYIYVYIRSRRGLCCCSSPPKC